MFRQVPLKAMIVIAGIILGFSLLNCQNAPPGSVEPSNKISIAAHPFSFTGYTVYVAKEKGYFKDNGLDVLLKRSYNTGKATINAVTTGEAEFGVSSETPFMHAVLSGKQIYACATMITAEKHLGIVARRDRGISKPSDLKGKQIGVTIGSNGEYFLDTALLLHGVTKDDVLYVHLKPKAMLDALMNSEVDAIATWNPQMFRAQKALKDNGISFYAKGYYLPSFLLTTTKNYADKNLDIVEKVIKSLLTASNFIAENPEESNSIVSSYIQVDSSILDELSSIYYFNISLEQSLLLSLEHQSSWAIDNNLTSQTIVPNYLDFIYTDALDAVKPQAVTIIK